MRPCLPNLGPFAATDWGVWLLPAGPAPPASGDGGCAPMIKLERVYDAVRCAGPTSALRSSDLADRDVPTPAGHRASDDPLEAVIAQLLTTLGIELDNQHFRRTPVRVAKFYREFTRGYVARPADILKTFRSPNRDLILVSNIDFYLLCH